MAMIRPETEMKDTGIEWIGNIPSSWVCCKQKYVISLINGRAFKDTEFEEDGKYRILRVGNFFSNPKWYSSNLELEDDKYCDNGDLLYAWSMSYGPYIWNGEKVIYHYHIWKAKLLNNLSKRFAYYYLIALSDSIKSDVHETTMSFITMKSMNNSYIAFPEDIFEQQAIADYLDETCSKIDEIIAEAKASIDEYKELKQSVIFEAVTKGLDKNVEMKDSGVKAIGKVNNKYNVAKIAELNDGLTDGTHGTYERFDSGKLLLSSKNVQHNGLVIGNNESYISEEDSNSIVANGFPQKNDLLLCCIGASIGRCILYPFDYPIAFQRSVIFIRCNKWILPKMMMYNLQSTSSLMQEQMVVNVSAQAGLYQGLVKQLYVTVPPIGEQEKIILFLDKKTAEIDSLIAEKESLINDLEAYKKSLIYEVVTGKRRVV